MNIRIFKMSSILLVALLIMPSKLSGISSGTDRYPKPILSTVLSVGRDNQENIATGLNLGAGLMLGTPHRLGKISHQYVILPQFQYQKLHSISNPLEEQALLGGGVEFLRKITNKPLWIDVSGRALHLKGTEVMGYQIEGGVVYVFGGWVFPAGIGVSYTNTENYEAWCCRIRFDFTSGLLMFFL